MSDGRWIAAAATLAAIVLYELWHTLAQRRRPHALARVGHWNAFHRDPYRFAHLGGHRSMKKQLVERLDQLL